MKDCTNPAGHTWRPTHQATHAGTVHVECIWEGCGEWGYVLAEEVAQNPGRSE